MSATWRPGPTGPRRLRARSADRTSEERRHLGSGSAHRAYTSLVTGALSEDADSFGLVTDLYHPDAAYVAWRLGRLGVTTFDMYTRRAPGGGSFILVAGLETAIEFVRNGAEIYRKT